MIQPDGTILVTYQYHSLRPDLPNLTLDIAIGGFYTRKREYIPSCADSPSLCGDSGSGSLIFNVSQPHGELILVGDVFRGMKWDYSNGIGSLNSVIFDLGHVARPSICEITLKQYDTSLKWNCVLPNDKDRTAADQIDSCVVSLLDAKTLNVLESKMLNSTNSFFPVMWRYYYSIV